MRDNYFIQIIKEDFNDKGQIEESIIGTLGSSKHKMEGEAYGIHFSPKITGIKELVFNIPTHYLNTASGQMEINPRYQHLQNEKRLRLFHREKFYDFLVKEITDVLENNGTKYVTVRSEDANISDLAGKGWGLYFDEYNGIGTLQELAPQILEETEWSFDAANSDTFLETAFTNIDGIPNTEAGANQYAQKVSYDTVKGRILHYHGSRSIMGLPATGPDQIEVMQYTMPQFHQSEVGKNFLVNGSDFFTTEQWGGGKLSVTQNGSGNAYPRSLRVEQNSGPIVNNSLNNKNYQFAVNNAYTFSITCKNSAPQTLDVEISDNHNEYMNRVVKQSIYIPANNNWTTYGFQFLPVVSGYNNRVFLNFSGAGAVDIGKVRVELGGRNAILNSDFSKDLQYWRTSPNGLLVNNTAILKGFDFRPSVLRTNQILTTNYASSYMKSLNSGDLSTLSFAIRGDSAGKLTATISGWKSGVLDQHTLNFDYTVGWQNLTGAFQLVSMTGYDNIEIQFKPTGTIYITDIKLEHGAFSSWTPALEDELPVYIYTPTAQFIKREFYYYYENGIETKLNLTAMQIAKLVKIGVQLEKIRTLRAEKSNCFNILQELCELFEGWLELTVHYNPDGTVQRRPDGTRLKTVSFKKDNGKDLIYKIKKGVNLTGLKRKINSDQIVTKMFVEDNDFKYADAGVVSIAQSSENPSGETYIINLNHFVETGQLTNQAKVDTAVYETNLKHINTILQSDMFLVNQMTTEVAINVEPPLGISSITVVALEESIKTIETEISASTPNMDRDALREKLADYKQKLNFHKTTFSELTIKKESYEGQIKVIQARIDGQLAEKKKIVKAFNSKYANFIHEGSWQDSNYIYPDLYYRDALDVSNRSGEPEVSFEASILDISLIPNYEHYNFAVGDRGFIDNKDLFLSEADDKYYQNDIAIFISEIDFVLDDPKSTSIKLQNYKSRFKDIFQKILASAETLRLNEQIYDRSAGFTQNGEIAIDILQNSLLNNNLILARSGNNSVVIDNRGITVSDMDNPNRMVKIVSGGIFLTKDGINWKAGITPDGISMDAITAGSIDTKKLTIWNSQEPRFYWDANGLVAYGIDKNGRSDLNSRIIFNHDGLIFTRNADLSLAELSLTWEGLRINLQDGAVKIGSGGGIVVEDNQNVPIKRVEIGKINRLAGESQEFSETNPLPNPIYGMILRNREGLETLVTSDNGELWLKRALSVGDQGTQDMAGVSGITSYTTRELTFYIRNEQKMNLEEAIKENNQANINKWKKALEDPIPHASIVNLKNTLEADPIRFWSGANSPQNASFKVLQSGAMFATNAYIEGDVVATNGMFKGRVYVGYKNSTDINTGAGISGLKTDNVRFWAGADILGAEGYESDPEKGLFKVYNNGKVFATNMDVHGTITAGETNAQGDYLPTLFIAGENYLFNGIVSKKPIPANMKARLWVGGLSPNTSNLVITADGGLYASDVHVAGKIEGAGLEVANVIINEDGIFTKDYSPGMVGSGWYINNNGTADFNNVNVRGTISSAIFQHQTVQAIGGSMIIRTTSMLTQPFDFTGKLGTDVDIEVKEKDYFKVGDFLVIKEIAGRVILKVISINTTDLTVNVIEGGFNCPISTPVLNYGQTGAGGILLSASGNVFNPTSGPTIDMSTTLIENGELKEILKVRIGDLTDIVDTELPTEGYGLYADNVALKGSLFLPKAGVYSGSEIAEGEKRAIRFWAGTNWMDRQNANFKVYDDGTVLARGGIFEGKIIADTGGFSGSVGLAGITINDNTGSFYIQKRQGNTENFNTIAMFSSDGITIYDGGIRIFKSLTDQSLTKPNQFRYLYPYVMAANDPDIGASPRYNERFIMRKAHFWSFDTENDSATYSKNYSIGTHQTIINFAQGNLTNQDKTNIRYVAESFNTTSTDGFYSYMANSKLTLEKNYKNLAILQHDNTDQYFLNMKVTNYKKITDPNNFRKYELSFDITAEYADAEEAFVLVQYCPQQTKPSYVETLKFDLPTLKGGKVTTRFKELYLYGYDASKPFTFKFGVENSTKLTEAINNRAIIHSIRLVETTSTVAIAEQGAFDMARQAEMGLNNSNQFVIFNHQARPLLFNNTSMDQKVGINLLNPTYNLQVTGNMYASSNIVSATQVRSLGNVIGDVSVRAGIQNTAYTELNAGTLQILRNVGAGVYPQLQMYQNFEVGIRAAAHSIWFNSSKPGLHLHFFSTYNHDDITGQTSGGLFLANNAGVGGVNSASLAVQGNLYHWSGSRVPVIKSSTGYPNNGYYPAGPQKGDIFIRYV